MTELKLILKQGLDRLRCVEGAKGDNRGEIDILADRIFQNPRPFVSITG